MEKLVRQNRCSFCARAVDEVANIIQGPSVHICNECVAESRSALSGAPKQDWSANDGCCYFCQREETVGLRRVGKIDADARICEECVKLCEEVLIEEAKTR